MPNDVLDLDILKPAKKIIKIGGHEIDASFVPVAITWDVDRLIQELVSFGISPKPEETKRILDISCELCAVFSWRHEELTSEWFRQNADVRQINAFVDVIKDTLQRAYAGVEEYPGNAEAVQT